MLIFVAQLWNTKLKTTNCCICTEYLVSSVPNESIGLVTSAYIDGDGQHHSVIVDRRSQQAQKVVAMIDRTLPVVLSTVRTASNRMSRVEVIESIEKRHQALFLYSACRMHRSWGTVT
jgi:hypothetical protein